MEKKQTNLIKKILYVILIIFAIFIIHIVRNFMIFTNLSNKVDEKELIKNAYFKVTTQTATIEEYRKDDIKKEIILRNKGDVSITQITTPNHRIFIAKSGDEITRNEYDENYDFEIQSFLPNNTKYFSLSEKIISSITSKIKTQKENNTKYYIISGHNTNFMYDANSIDFKVYINKETGLTEKIVETINDNGNIYDNITIYEYEFNSVTDEDVLE